MDAHMGAVPSGSLPKRATLARADCHTCMAHTLAIKEGLHQLMKRPAESHPKARLCNLRHALAIKQGASSADEAPSLIPSECLRFSRMHGPISSIVADGHTVSNAPDLFRPPKLSGTGPG